MTGLFLEGYSLSSLEAEGASLSPASERLTRYVISELDTNRLLKLSKRQAQYRALRKTRSTPTFCTTRWRASAARRWWRGWTAWPT
jgi:hypothetical protein